MLFLLYVVATLAALISLVLFLFGRLFGGVLDPDAAAAARISDEEKRAAAIQGLSAPATQVGKVGRFLNAMGDNLQRASGLAFFFSALAVAAFAGITVWTEGRHLFILVVAVLAAGNMLYYLSAEPADRAKRAVLVSTLLTVIAVGAILIQVGFQNNTEWYNPQIAVGHSTVEDKTESFPILSTPNGTYLDLEKLVGVDANRVKGVKENGVFLATCLPGFNPDLAGYEVRCHEEKMQLRAQRAKPHSLNLAAHEFSSMHDLVLAREEDRLAALTSAMDVKETEIVQQKRAEKLEAGKLPLTSRLPIKGIVLAIIIILVGLGLLAYAHEEKKPEEKKDDKKPADPKAAAPKAA